MYGEQALILGFLGAMGFFSVIIPLALYILKSIGITALASNRGLENPWMGWIPVGDLYLIGKLLNSEMNLFGYQVKQLEIVFPAVMVGACVLGAVPLIGWLLGLASLVFGIAVLYYLFDMYTSNAVLFTVLSVIPGLGAIFIFAIRNNPPLNSVQPPGNGSDQYY